MNKRDENLIDQMETIRVRNNRNWMDIMRVALREAPEETRALIKDIAACDDRIRTILRDIAED